MKVSIITLVCNSSRTIERSLVSLKNQSYKNIEHIVIDCESTDGSVEIIKNHLSSIDFFESSYDSGIYDALNKGISKSTGEIIGILHSDDVFEDKNVITDTVNFFLQNIDLDICYGNAVIVDERNQISRFYNSGGFKPWMLRFGFMPAHTATFIKSDIFKTYGSYSIRYRSAGDFDFFVRVFLMHNISSKFFNRIIVRMSSGGISSSGFGSYRTTTFECLQSLRTYNIYTNVFLLFLRLPIKFFLKKRLP